MLQTCCVGDSDFEFYVDFTTVIHELRSLNGIISLQLNLAKP